MISTDFQKLICSYRLFADVRLWNESGPSTLTEGLRASPT